MKTKNNAMKKLLLFVGAVFTFGFASAQCTPDPQYTQPGIFPDSATNFMPAYETVLYNQTITTVVPPDTCVVIIFPPCTVLSLDSIVVESVTGLPPGMSFACANPQCQFIGGTTSCAIITGTPPLGSAGTYPLTIDLNAYVGGFGVPNPFTLTYYKIVVNPAPSSVGVESGNAFTVSANHPNPFDEITTIDYTLIENGKVKFEVYNLVGEMVYQTNLSGSKGMNHYQFNAADLSAGAYIYKMTNNGSVITKRMVVSK